ncbi:MAG: hypothetical protein P8N09_04955 [Planctomycetota bacterium]|jgi:hypothetical protein|nr:hypothetical protein [Planctomycetota bacterium]
MKRHLGARLFFGGLSVLLLASALLGGCSSPAPTPQVSPGPRQLPEWISRPSHIDGEGGEIAIFAVGKSDAHSNRSVQASDARRRARGELARTVNVLVQSMVRGFMETHRGYYESMDSASSVEYIQDISRQVTQQIISGAKLWEDFHDPIEKAYYALYKIDMTEVILSYRDQMNAAFRREVSRRRMVVDSEAFEVDLERQLNRLRGMTAKQIRASSGV